MIRSLALIPARGGSKRIPRKNIRPFLGKPIIQYPIDAALTSEIFTDVMVSTDDQEISDFAQKAGAIAPFLRSSEASNDFAGLADVALEALARLADSGQHYDTLCMILPTSPLLSKETLVECMAKLSGPGAIESIVPVTEFSYPVMRGLTMDQGHHLGWKWPEYAQMRSQDIEKIYHDVGQFYCIKVPHFLKTKLLIGPGSVGHRIDPRFVQDIDTEDDWAIAELKYRYLVEKL